MGGRKPKNKHSTASGSNARGGRTTERGAGRGGGGKRVKKAIDTGDTYTVVLENTITGEQKRRSPLYKDEMLDRVEKAIKFDPDLGGGTIITAHVNRPDTDDADYTKINKPWISGDSFTSETSRTLMESLIKFPDGNIGYNISVRPEHSLRKFIKKSRSTSGNSGELAFWFSRFSSPKNTMSPPRRLLRVINGEDEGEMSYGEHTMDYDGETIRLDQFLPVGDVISQQGKNFFIPREEGGPFEINRSLNRFSDIANTRRRFMLPDRSTTVSGRRFETQLTENKQRRECLQTSLGASSMKYFVGVQDRNGSLLERSGRLTRNQAIDKLMEYVNYDRHLKSNKTYTAFSDPNAADETSFKQKKLVKIARDEEFSDPRSTPFLIESLANFADGNMAYDLQARNDRSLRKFMTNLSNRDENSHSNLIWVLRLSSVSNPSSPARCLAKRFQNERVESGKDTTRDKLPDGSISFMILKNNIKSVEKSYFFPLHAFEPPKAIEREKREAESSATETQGANNLFTLITRSDEGLHVSETGGTDVLRELRSVFDGTSERWSGPYQSVLYPSNKPPPVEDYADGFIDMRSEPKDDQDFEVKTYEIPSGSGISLTDDTDPESSNGSWYKYHMSGPELATTAYNLMLEKEDPETERVVAWLKFGPRPSNNDLQDLSDFVQKLRGSRSTKH